MNQQPDKLFRDKLANWQKPAPISAWDRIEAQVSEKKDHTKWPFMAVASVLLLATVAIALTWKQDTGKAAERILATEKNVESPIQIPAETPVPEKIKSEPTAPANTIKKRANASNPSIASSKTRKTSSDNKTGKTPEPALPETSIAGTTVVDDILIANHTAQLTGKTSSPVIEESYKLVIDASVVNEKYFVEPAKPEATDGKKKSSGLKRLLVKAQKLKTNQDPFGELRQAKNEILAWNFRNEKNRNNSEH